MPDFLLELLSEEIPARMQAKAEADLARLLSEQLALAGLKPARVDTYATPRRLTLIARDLPAQTEPTREETKGPRTSAPPQALEGFLRKTGLTREQLEERDGIFYAVVEKPGRTTSSVLADAVPAVIRAFPWPKSMRWGEASTSNESLRWVRPLQGIVALLGEEIVEFEIAGVKSGAATVGHRFHHPGIITIGSANDYAEKLRACHVIIDPAERRRIIAEGAAEAAATAGLTLVEDEGLLAENAGLTEWPVPLLGSFDPAFLQVPREVIQLTMRTNQKYFALLSSSPAFAGEGDRAKRGGGAAEGGTLAPNFICTANIEAADGGAAIVQGNQKVLAARLSDAKFFWEQDLKIPLEDQVRKLEGIVFHEKLGTLADKVDRVAKLARWLVEEGIVKPPLPQARGDRRGGPVEAAPSSDNPSPSPSREREGSDLASLAETAARLCKADLVTQMVGEFPELQGIIGGHLARAQGHPAAVADAIRDHYKPVGQGDEVPTAPVTVAVSLADKLDTIAAFFAFDERPSGSRDPFALRRAAISSLSLLISNDLRLPLIEMFIASSGRALGQAIGLEHARLANAIEDAMIAAKLTSAGIYKDTYEEQVLDPQLDALASQAFEKAAAVAIELVTFFADRLKVQQREAGVRHDLIDAVFALGGEDDLVRLLARVRALQSFVETPEGADLLAGYKRAANILKKEGWVVIPAKAGTQEQGESESRTASEAPAALGPGLRRDDEKVLSYTPLPEEAQLIAALESAEPRAAQAVAAEDFEGAMAALASLRAPVDAFFDKVTVNDPDPAKREARLDLLARMRDAVHQVADFSRIEG